MFMFAWFPWMLLVSLVSWCSSLPKDAVLGCAVLGVLLVLGSISNGRAAACVLDLCAVHAKTNCTGMLAHHVVLFSLNPTRHPSRPSHLLPCSSHQCFFPLPRTPTQCAMNLVPASVAYCTGGYKRERGDQQGRC